MFFEKENKRAEENKKEIKTRMESCWQKPCLMSEQQP
jgi:hypothetical protein